QDVARPQRLHHRRDFRAGTRLVAAHARQADPVLAVRILDKPRAVEAVVGGSSPNVWRAERLEGGLHDVDGVPRDRYRWSRGREVGWGSGATAPPAPLPLAHSDRDPQRSANALARGAARSPEATWPPVLQPGEGAGPQARPPAPPLDLVTRAVKRTAVTQAVVHEDGDPEALREGRARTDASISPEFVGVRAVAVVPPADMKLQAAPLGGERRRCEREQQQRDRLSPPRQRRLAPATGAAPCDGRGGEARVA